MQIKRAFSTRYPQWASKRKSITKQVLSGLMIVFFALGCNRTPKTFTEMLHNLNAIQSDKRDSYISSWLKGRSLPLVEHDHVYFIYKNDKEIPVFLTGDMNGWKKDQIPFLKIIGSEYYYCEQIYEPDSRLEYKLIADDKWILDPLNKKKAIGGYGENSLLLLPDYVYAPETLLDRHVIYTTLDTVLFKSTRMRATYQSFYYKNILADSASPLIIFNDGGDYLNYGAAWITLDNLIRTKEIPPCQALFLQPHDRMKEYWMDEKFLQMVFDDCLPWAKQKYNIDRAVPIYMGGASLGGLTAFFAITKTKLDGVFSQSGSFWVDSLRIIDELKNEEMANTKFYFDFGSFEKQDSTRSAMMEFLDANHISYTQNVWHEGHNWGNWRGHLSYALRYLLNPSVPKKTIKL